MNPSKQFQPGADAQLLEQIGQMMTDSDGRDVKAGGNVFVGQTLSDQQGDLLFTIGLLDGLRVRLRRPHVRAASAGFRLERLATAFMNNPGWEPVRH